MTDVAATIDQVLFARTTRSFIVASTRSGKSTLAAALLDCYHRLYPSDSIYIIDPKHRYYALRDDKEDSRIFPYGFRSEVYGRRKGVVVNGIIAEGEKDFRVKNVSVYVVQHDDVVLDFLRWQFRAADINFPSVVFADETWDILDEHDPGRYYRRLIQEGGDMGVATLTINQRPRNIDPTYLSESEQIYVGHLRKIEDREYLKDQLDIPDEQAYELWKVPLPQYTWQYVNQIDPRKNRKFRLGRGFE